MNHRIFERTLRPSVFRGAYLFERHCTPQASLGIGPRPRGVPEKQWRSGVTLSVVNFDPALKARVVTRQATLTYTVYPLSYVIPLIDLGSGRDTR